MTACMIATCHTVQCLLAATDVRDAGGQSRHADSRNSGLDCVCHCRQPRASRHNAFGACIAPQHIITAPPKRLRNRLTFCVMFEAMSRCPRTFAAGSSQRRRCCRAAARAALALLWNQVPVLHNRACFCSPPLLASSPQH